MPFNDPPWHPITNPVELKILGKLAEELGECSAAVARCIIQGINETEPVTGKPNKQWLMEELSDVMTCMGIVIRRFDISINEMEARTDRKQPGLEAWHAGA